MRARFIGKDYSMGYRTGQVYDIVVTTKDLRPTIVSPTPCPYSSWEALYDNWTPIRWEEEAQNAEV